MGKTIRLTEEQIRRFFGEGFGRTLLGEAGTNRYSGKASLNPGSPEAGEVYQYDPLYKKAYDAQGKNGLTPDETGISGPNYGSRVSKSFPGRAEAWLKMQQLGNAGMVYSPDDNYPGKNALNFGEDYAGYNDAIFAKLYELNGNKPIGLIDAIFIMHDINDNGNKLEITNQVIENFLNSLSMTTILSNFVSVNAPDYVYGRLLRLSKEELTTIEKEYGRDFKNWGRKCDGCGISKWKTNVIVDEHDDAHINLEYMGGERGYGGSSVNEGKSKTTKTEPKNVGGRKLVERDIPFQIHHMNENPSDNTPLNLSCLCPNCHALTGSYGKQKSAIEGTPDFLKNYLSGDGGLVTNLTDEERKRLEYEMEQGNFESRTLANQLVGTNADVKDSDVVDGRIAYDAFLLHPEEIKDSSLVNAGIDPSKKEELVNDFNRLFVNIYSDAKDEFKKYFGKLNEEVEGDADDNGEFIDSGETHPLKILDYDLRFNLKVSKNGTVSLHIYLGKEPDYIDAFDNPAIPFNRVFWSPSERIRVQTTKEIRNEIFFAILNSIRSSENSINRFASSPIASEYRGVGGKAYNMSKLARDQKSGKLYAKMNGEVWGTGFPDPEDIGKVFGSARREMNDPAFVSPVRKITLSKRRGNGSDSLLKYEWSPEFVSNIIDFLKTEEGQQYLNKPEALRDYLLSNDMITM